MKTLLSTGAAKANDLYTVTTTSISEGELVSRVAAAVLDALQEEDYNLNAPCILCGCGNNGADGMALAVLLKEKGLDVQVVYTGKLYEPAPEPKKRKKNQPAPEPMDPEKIGTPELEAMSEQCRERYAQLLTAKIPVLTELPDTVTVYIDAVFGISFHGTLNAKIAAMFKEINASDIPVVSIDIPSGVCADTGAVAAGAVCADLTVTVQALKTGLILYPGAQHAGKIKVADVGIEQSPETMEKISYVLEDEDASLLSPERPARSCKATFGRVLVIAGTPGMAGAAYLAATAAYRAGAGLVEILTHSNNRTILQQLIPEAIVTTYFGKKRLTKTVKNAVARADAIVIGCGMGQGAISKRVLKTALRKATVPCVVDADALRLIAAKPGMLKGVNKKQKPQVLITPHVGEAAGLLGKKVSTDTVLADVYTASATLVEKYQVNVLLKDTCSVINCIDGDVYVNTAGSTALATAGSGDVLAGLIGGLAAAKTHKNSIGTTAALAAYMHGKAGEAAEQSVGAQAAMAREILDGLTK